jgi:hypothetical protein
MRFARQTPRQQFRGKASIGTAVGGSQAARAKSDRQQI